MPRTKPSVRIHLSIAHHPKTADLWSTRDGRAVLSETMRLAAERFAGKRGNRVQLLPADRLSIACADTLDDADGLLSEVYEEVGWGVRRLGKDGRRWEVSVRNFSKKQGYGTEESDTIRGVPRERMCASDSDSDSDSKSNSEKKRGPTMCPDRLSDEERVRLKKWAEANDFTDAHLGFAWKAVKDWAAARGVMRRDWAAVLRQAMRKGWALEGFTQTAAGTPKWCDCTHTRDDTERATETCRNCGRRIRPRRGR